MRREVQRILMELLNQMDGFDQNVNVKVKTAPSPSPPPQIAHLARHSKMQSIAGSILAGNALSVLISRTLSVMLGVPLRVARVARRARSSAGCARPGHHGHQPGQTRWTLPCCGQGAWTARIEFPLPDRRQKRPGVPGTPPSTPKSAPESMLASSKVGQTRA